MTSPSTQATRPAPSQRVPRASLGHRGVLSSFVPPCTFLHASQLASCTSHASSWQPSFHVFACQRSTSNEPYEFRTTRSPGKRGIAKTVYLNGPQCPPCSRGGDPREEKRVEGVQRPWHKPVFSTKKRRVARVGTGVSSSEVDGAAGIMRLVTLVGREISWHPWWKADMEQKRLDQHDPNCCHEIHYAIGCRPYNLGEGPSSTAS